MRYVVGYGPKERGIDALQLAATLAVSPRPATLDVVSVLPGDAPSFHMYSPDRAFNRELERESHEWLDQALSRLPEGVPAEGRLLRAGSVAEGLTAAATGPGREPASMIVVGTSHRVRTGLLQLGSISDVLLHSAPVPVAMAPRGYGRQSRITGVTCATGTREGAEALVRVAIREAADRRVPLRLMSLVALGAATPEDREAWGKTAGRHVESLAREAARHLPPECPVDTVIGEGESLEDAVAGLEFTPGELVMIGSSRMAQPRRLFIGASANRILRALPVPVVVVPRDYQPPADPTVMPGRTRDAA